MRKIIWEVQYQSSIPVLKHCKKCGRQMRHSSSGQFRINAQGKDLDVWLIYKCENCKSTWNVTIFSRVKSKSLDQKLLEKFHNNDQVIANDYAMNAEVLCKNGGEVGVPSYKVIGDNIPFNEEVELHIKTSYKSRIKVSTILREKLQLSQRDYEDMVVNKQIKGLSMKDFKRCKLNEGIVLFINRKEYI